VEQLAREHVIEVMISYQLKFKWSIWCCSNYNCKFNSSTSNLHV